MWKFTRALLAAGIAAWLLTIPAAADEPSWRSFSTADGLPAKRTLALAQSTNGTLWAGTELGLRYFFDRSFHADAFGPPEVNTGHINALLATPDGSLWVATTSGLHRRRADGTWDRRLEQQAGLQTPNFTALLLARDGAVWVGGTNGLARWDGNSWQVVTIADLPPQVIALAEDAAGRVWVAEPSQIDVLQASMVVKVIGAEDGLPLGAELTALVPDNQGDMWAATTNGLAHFTGLTMLHVYTQANGLGNNAVGALLQDSSHGLWVGTEFGLSDFAGGSVQRNLTSADGLADDKVRALLRDREGNLWVGTDGGLTRLPIGAWAVEDDPLLNRIAVNAFFANGPDGSYVAVPGGLAHRTQDGNWSMIKQGFSGHTVYAFTRDGSGQVWVGSDGGLAQLEGQQFIPNPIVPLTTTVNALLTDGGSSLWLGTDNGLVRLVGGTTMTYTKSGGELGQDRVMALWETKEGDVWAGTLNGGASRFRQGTWLTVTQKSNGKGLVDNIVLVGLQDSAGNLWFGTSQGLSRLQAGAVPTDGSAWHTFVEPQLADNRVNALWEDVDHPGHIWVGTDGGLNLIVGDEISAFSTQDGLSHKKVLSLGQNGGGTLWIGTALGLTYHEDFQREPQIELRDLLVDNKVCDTQCQKGASYQSRTATFQFDGSDLADLNGLRYQVEVVGASDSAQVQVLHDLTAITSVPVALAPGITYTLTVKALDRDFNASPVSSLTLRVNPPNNWERLRDSPLFPIVILGAVVIIIPGSVYGTGLWRRRRRYGYLDLQVTVRQAAISGVHQIQLNTPRRPQFPEYDRSLDVTLLQPLLAHLRQDETDERQLAFLGGLLYAALFSADAAAYLQQQLGLGRKGIRLRLRFENAPQLERLPWEYLHGGDKLEFITIKSNVAIVRDLSPDTREPPPRTRLPLKLLVVWATPQDLPQLEVAKEATDIKDAFAGLIGQGRAVVQILEHASPESFAQAVRTGQDLIHFAGHGGVKDGSGVLYFEDEDQDAVTMTQAALTALLADSPTFTDNVPKLFAINACRTAEPDDQAGLMGLAEALVSAGDLSAVVGMGYPISTGSAAIFSQAFYETLVRHGQVDYSVARGRAALFAQVGGAKRDWGVPRLYSRTPEGVVFELT